MRFLTFVLALVVIVGICMRVAWRETKHSPAYFEAQKLVREVQWKEAIPLYDKALKENPNDAVCLARRGFAYAQIGNYWQAFSDFDESLKADRNCWDAYSRRARVCAWLGLDSLARSDAKRGLALMPIPPEDSYILLEHATLLSILGKTLQSNDELNHALELTKGRSGKDIQLERIFILYKLNRNIEAFHELNSLMQAGKIVDIYALMRADIELAQNKYDQASKDYEYYTYKAPEDPRGYFGLGLCQDKLNNHRWATNCLEKAFEKAPNFLYAYLECERIYTTAQVYDSAVKCITKVIELEPNEAWYFARRAFDYCNLKEWKKAKADATRAIELNPRFEYSYTYLSWANQNLGDQTSAVADLNKAVDLAPKSAAMYYARALYYREQKAYPKAIEDFDRAIALDSKEPKFFCARGSALLSSGKYKDAISSCTESIRINPNRSHPYFSRGSAYSRMGNYQLALKDLSYLVTKYPDYGEAWYERSKVYKAMGNDAQAKSDMVKAVKFGYGHPEAM